MKPGDGDGNHGGYDELGGFMGGSELPLLFGQEADPPSVTQEKTESAVPVKKDKKPIPRHGR